MFTVDTGVHLGKTETQVDTGVGAGVFVVRRSQSWEFLEKL